MSGIDDGSTWTQAPDGSWQSPEPPAPGGVLPVGWPPPPAPVPQPIQPGFVLTIGDIGVTPEYVVTPNGTGPLAGSQWIVTDRSTVTTRIPAWAIVLAIIFAFACLLGLFFLLAKETVITGYVEVSVHSGNVVHVTQLPVSTAEDVNRYRALVHQAQSLTAQATHR
jgi:hypothetical protein